MCQEMSREAEDIGGPGHEADLLRTLNFTVKASVQHCPFVAYPYYI